jgi:hypothetical protein
VAQLCQLIIGPLPKSSYSNKSKTESGLNVHRTNVNLSAKLDDLREIKMAKYYVHKNFLICFQDFGGYYVLSIMASWCAQNCAWSKKQKGGTNKRH